MALPWSCRWRCRGVSDVPGLLCPAFGGSSTLQVMLSAVKRAVIILVYSRKKALIVIAYGAVPKPEQAVIHFSPLIASRKRLSWFFSLRNMRKISVHGHLCGIFVFKGRERLCDK